MSTIARTLNVLWDDKILIPDLFYNINCPVAIDKKSELGFVKQFFDTL